MRAGGEVIDKPGHPVPETCALEVKEDPNPFVSRGGLKLQHALETFGLNPQGCTAIDIGASTGGFTDCLLQRGASKVIAVDVGYGQLDWKVRSDERVVVMDRTNARGLTPDDLETKPDFAVVDVSFISLRLILPALIPLLTPGAHIVALVKPQFEVGKDEVENKGVIKDPQKHFRVLKELCEFTQTLGWTVTGLTPSPIKAKKATRNF